MRFKSGFIASLVLVLAFAGFCRATKDENKDIKEKVEKESREMQAAALKTEELVKKDRAQLQEILQGLKKDLDKEKSSLKRAKEGFNDLSEQKTALEKEIEEEKDAVKDVQGTVFTAAKNAHSLVQKSPVSSKYQDRFEKLEPLLEKERFPGMEGIKDLAGVFGTEMRESGNIEKYGGEIIGEQGKKQKADIVRVGAMNSVYRDSQGNVGFLEMNSQGEMVAVPADLSWFVRGDIEDYIQGESAHLPMDLSGGAVFKRLSQSRGFVDWIEAGGILIWPIFLVALAALLITIERLLFLARIRSNSDRIMLDINSCIENQDWEGCRKYCEKNSRFPTCRVFGSVMEHMGQTREVMENAIQEAIMRQVPRLERFLPTLNILGAIAPLLGLLGTVTGMINTFQIITLFGTGDPKMMSGGISEALVTTQLGLAIAIPIMLMHHFLERRVDKIVGDIEEKGNSFTLSLIKHGIVKGEDK
ncbi:MAG: MotA/TolQ/ExbB proton channel family protein [Thermodesulfobacteriota bacterium]